MERKTFLLALLALPFIFFKEKGDRWLGEDYRLEKIRSKGIGNGGKLINGHRPRRGNPPPEPWKRKIYPPFKTSEKDDFKNIDIEMINNVDTSGELRKPPKPMKNYKQPPLQYWGIEPIEDLDLLG